MCKWFENSHLSKNKSREKPPRLETRLAGNSSHKPVWVYFAVAQAGIFTRGNPCDSVRAQLPFFNCRELTNTLSLKASPCPMCHPISLLCSQLDLPFLGLKHLLSCFQPLSGKTLLLSLSCYYPSPQLSAVSYLTYMTTSVPWMPPSQLNTACLKMDSYFLSLPETGVILNATIAHWVCTPKHLFYALLKGFYPSFLLSSTLHSTLSACQNREPKLSMWAYHPSCQPHSSLPQGLSMPGRPDLTGSSCLHLSLTGHLVYPDLIGLQQALPFLCLGPLHFISQSMSYLSSTYQSLPQWDQPEPQARSYSTWSGHINPQESVTAGVMYFLTGPLGVDRQFHKGKRPRLFSPPMFPQMPFYIDRIWELQPSPFWGILGALCFLHKKASPITQHGSRQLLLMALATSGFPRVSHRAEKLWRKLGSTDAIHGNQTARKQPATFMSHSNGITMAFWVFLWRKTHSFTCSLTLYRSHSPEGIDT